MIISSNKGKVVFLGCIHHIPINTTLHPSFALSPSSPHSHLISTHADLDIGGSKAGTPGLPSDAVHS